MFERFTDPNARGAEWNLQLLVFGMLLANQSLRGKVLTGDFSHHDFRVAFDGLKTGKRKLQQESIARILEACGVEYLPTDGSPIDAALMQLKLDGMFQMAVDWLNMASHNNSYHDPKEKLQFLERLQGAGAELFGTRETGVLKIKDESK